MRGPTRRRSVLGYRFWQRQFGGDRSVVGRQLRLNDQVRTVVGVMPKRFMWRGADVYLPITFERGQVVEGVRTVHLLGRLKPGVNDAQAEADLLPIVRDIVAKMPSQSPAEWRAGLLSFKETFPSSIRNNLWVLFGAVGLLLLIACANVSNLLLSRAAGRQRRDGGALGARRQPLADGPPTADRKRAAGIGGRCAWRRARLWRAAGDPHARATEHDPG